MGSVGKLRKVFLAAAPLVPPPRLPPVFHPSPLCRFVIGHFSVPEPHAKANAALHDVLILFRDCHLHRGKNKALTPLVDLLLVAYHPTQGSPDVRSRQGLFRAAYVCKVVQYSCRNVANKPHAQWFRSAPTPPISRALSTDINSIMPAAKKKEIIGLVDVLGGDPVEQNIETQRKHLAGLQPHLSDRRDPCRKEKCLGTAEVACNYA